MSDGSWSPPEVSHATVALRDVADAVERGGLIGDRYRVLSLLGRGGIGEVYEAEDAQLGGRVALKVVRGAARDAAAVALLKREIQLARKVTHPNVCRLHDFGTHRFPDGREAPFLTMELLDGETLAHRIRSRGPIAPDEALALAKQMADALDAAHSAGVVHRDFKSSNVMLVGARAIATDFGLATELADAHRLGDAALIGSPAYMAPEQIEGGPLTPATDVYAFGVVLFEMITGRLPFEGATPMAMAMARLQTPAPSPRAIAPRLDRRWERAILRCLRTEPSLRFARCHEVIAAIEAPEDPPKRTPPVSRTSIGTLAIVFGLGGLLFMGLIFGAIALWLAATWQ